MPRYCRVMALGLDAQVHAEIASMVEALGKPEPPPVGDVETRRTNGHRMFDYVASTTHPRGVDTALSLTTADGATLVPPGTAHRRGSSPAVRCCTCTAAA